LVKYAFFPHTVQPGPGHKGDITKASRYAKLINKALDENIPPTEFVVFAESTAFNAPQPRRNGEAGLTERRGVGRGARQVAHTVGARQRFLGRCLSQSNHGFTARRWLRG
jgi:hypothetical protein